ncbi:hypothetical protein BC941DRAFT_408075 [Chlamydoabsidia padenii]|nr:hypothetical protein BC941DRAFT_408075 [Chlamydoabsidia padenii]
MQCYDLSLHYNRSKRNKVDVRWYDQAVCLYYMFLTYYDITLSRFSLSNSLMSVMVES